MPFRSAAQREFMYANHPDIARRWAAVYGPQKGLPEHVKKIKRGKRLVKRGRQ